jgi:HSP20 family protein
LDEDFKKRRFSPWQDGFDAFPPYKPGRFHFGIKEKTPIYEFKGSIFKMNIKNGEFEPLTDIIEKELEIIVVTELQGVKKEELEVKVQGKTLIIISRREELQHYKALDLPKPVNPTPALLTLKNGVLTIKLEKIHEDLIEVKKMLKT